MQVLCEAVYQLEEAKTALFKSILLQMSPSNPIAIFSNDLYLRVNFLTAVVLAQIQPNATKLTVWCFLVQMDNGPQYFFALNFSRRNGIFFNNQVSHLISAKYAANTNKRAGTEGDCS